MARRSVTIVAAGLALTAVVGGCGSGDGPTTAGTAGGSGGSGTVVTLFAPGSEGGDAVLSFAELAGEAADGYRLALEEAGRTHAGAADDDGSDWWVYLDVEVPLTEADLDDPLAALPPVLAPLAPEVRSARFQADGPLGPIQYQADTPVVGLRAELDGSHQAVTTVPGDEPPGTTTWEIDGARLTRLSVPVVAADELVGAEAIIAEVGAGHITIGPPRTGGYLTMDDALAGIAPTAPPVTGTRPPPMSTDTASDPGAATTTSR